VRYWNGNAAGIGWHVIQDRRSEAERFHVSVELTSKEDG
jgi:hypothetical protein